MQGDSVGQVLGRDNCRRNLVNEIIVALPKVFNLDYLGMPEAKTFHSIYSIVQLSLHMRLKMKQKSLRQLAKELGVSPSYLSQVKNGKRPPSARLLGILSESVKQVTGGPKRTVSRTFSLAFSLAT